MRITGRGRRRRAARGSARCAGASPPPRAATATRAPTEVSVARRYLILAVMRTIPLTLGVRRLRARALHPLGGVVVAAGRGVPAVPGAGGGRGAARPGHAGRAGARARRGAARRAARAGAGPALVRRAAGRRRLGAAGAPRAAGRALQLLPRAAAPPPQVRANPDTHHTPSLVPTTCRP